MAKWPTRVPEVGAEVKTKHFWKDVAFSMAGACEDFLWCQPYPKHLAKAVLGIFPGDTHFIRNA